jgi:hypothetical protein
VTETPSIRQPLPPRLSSLPIRNRSATVRPAAAAGRFTVVVTKAFEVVPVQARRPARGLPKAVLMVSL